MRLQFEVDEEEMTRLGALKTKTGARTMRDLFGSAIALLEWAVEESEKKYKIASFEERNVGRLNVIEFPALRHARKLK